MKNAVVLVVVILLGCASNQSVPGVQSEVATTSDSIEPRFQATRKYPGPCSIVRAGSSDFFEYDREGRRSRVTVNVDKEAGAGVALAPASSVDCQTFYDDESRIIREEIKSQFSYRITTFNYSEVRGHFTVKFVEMKRTSEHSKYELWRESSYDIHEEYDDLGRVILKEDEYIPLNDPLEKERSKIIKTKYLYVDSYRVTLNFETNWENLEEAIVHKFDHMENELRIGVFRVGETAGTPNYEKLEHGDLAYLEYIFETYGLEESYDYDRFGNILNHTMLLKDIRGGLKNTYSYECWNE